MNWLAAALAAPALWSITTVIDHNLINKVYPSSLFGTIISGTFAGIPVFLLVNHYSIPVFYAAVAIFAGCVSLYQFYTYFQALKLNAPSLVVAFYNLSAVFVPILSYIFLGERLGLSALIGFMLVLIPSIVMNFYSLDRLHSKKAIKLMLTTTVLYSISLVTMKYVYDATSFEAGFGYFSLGNLIGIASLLLYSARARKVFGEAKAIGFLLLIVFLLIEVISLLADTAQSYAISVGSVSLTTALEGVQPIFVLIIGLVFYPLFPKLLPEALEGNKLLKLGCMLVMVAGIYVISQATI